MTNEYELIRTHTTRDGVTEEKIPVLADTFSIENGVIVFEEYVKMPSGAKTGDTERICAFKNWDEVDKT